MRPHQARQSRLGHLLRKACCGSKGSSFFGLHPQTERWTARIPPPTLRRLSCCNYKLLCSLLSLEGNSRDAPLVLVTQNSHPLSFINTTKNQRALIGLIQRWVHPERELKTRNLMGVFYAGAPRRIEVGSRLRSTLLPGGPLRGHGIHLRICPPRSKGARALVHQQAPPER